MPLLASRPNLLSSISRTTESSSSVQFTRHTVPRAALTVKCTKSNSKANALDGGSGVSIGRFGWSDLTSDFQLASTCTCTCQNRLLDYVAVSGRSKLSKTSNLILRLCDHPICILGDFFHQIFLDRHAQLNSILTAATDGIVNYPHEITRFALDINVMFESTIIDLIFEEAETWPLLSSLSVVRNLLSCQLLASFYSPGPVACSQPPAGRSSARTLHHVANQRCSFEAR